MACSMDKLYILFYVLYEIVMLDSDLSFSLEKIRKIRNCFPVF